MYEYQTANPAEYALLKEFAAKNRKNMTEAESVFWQCLRGKNLGVPFKRQHIIGEYIADFACIEKGLVIEIDGGYHSLPDKIINGKERTQWLNAHGFDVLRFSNEEVLLDTDYVLNAITKYIES